MKLKKTVMNEENKDEKGFKRTKVVKIMVRVI
jgi:hypothetical protein